MMKTMYRCDKVSLLGAEAKDCSTESKHRSLRLRVMVIVCLMVTTVISGYFPYAFFKYLEYTRAIQEYEAVVQQTESTFQVGIANQVYSLRAVDTVMRSTCPLAATWPNCSLTPEVFDTLSESLEEMSGMVGIGTAPLISASNQREVMQFEHFASNLYLDAGFTHFGTWRYPNSTVRGVAAMGPDGIFHDTLGHPDSPNDLVAPVLHFSGATKSAATAGIVLFNINFDPPRFEAIGDAVDCTAGGGGNTCDRITDFIVLRGADGLPSPGALIVHPVSVQGQLEGIVFTIHYWSDLIAYSIPNYVRGLVVVVSCLDGSFVYHYDDGVVSSAVKETHRHEHLQGRNRHSFVANIQGKGELSYEICIYTSDAYFQDFQDDRATYACVIGVMISVLTTILFFTYDFVLGRAARENAVVLATKRAFVRYISHEIRTPLNTVNVGLKVLMQELGGLPGQGASFARRQGALMELVREVEESSEAAVGILNDLINYDKLSMHTMQLEVLLLDAWALLRDAFEPFLVQARQKHITMTLTLGDGSYSSTAGGSYGSGDISRASSASSLPWSTPQSSADPLSSGALPQTPPPPSPPPLPAEIAGPRDEDGGADGANGGAGAGVVVCDSRASSSAASASSSRQRLFLLGDSVKLKQVMRNLLSNALKFTPVNGHIEVTGNHCVYCRFSTP